MRYIRLAAAVCLMAILATVNPTTTTVTGVKSIAAGKSSLVTPAWATQDATSAWNSVAYTYGFAQAPSAGTFADNWPVRPMFGTTCQAQLDACTDAVNGILGATMPPPIETGAFTYTIEHWDD